MGRDDENDESSKSSPADLETRVALDDGVLDAPDDPNAGHARDELTAREAASIAETVLADEDDRTQLVAHPTGAEAAIEAARDVASEAATTPGPRTRVIDPAATASDPDASSALAAAAAGAATRVLDPLDDKTSPPAVRASPPQPAPAAVAAPNAADEGLQPGTVLFGEYEIVSVLGVGGMGEVYRARHRRLDEFRAIKVMHADLSKKKGASEFFYREAKALLAVRHPAVVHCHDLLSDDAGRVYLVMEMIEGIPLSEKMNEGPLSADDVATLGARVSHGLSAAHRKGVIHRDVSPDNIVLPNGRVQEAKLIDFGIAKILEEGEGTIVDGFKGKLSYASPEQLGFFGGKLDGRSDFYSLGLVLVAAALGRPMGMGTTVMEAVDARRGFETLPDEIPIGLRSAIAPLLALDPKDRPKYVDRLFVVPGGVEGAHSGVYSRSRGSTARNSDAPAAGGWASRVAAAAVAGLVIAGGGGYWWSTTTDSNASPRGAEAAQPAPAVVPTPARELASPEQDAPDSAIVEETEVAAPVAESAVAEAESAPAPRRLGARDRIKIIGLITNAKLALAENRLMTPAGDNAFDRYQAVLALDPKNRQARAGLRTVADRYLELAESASRGGDAAQAKEYLAKARQADAQHPKLAVVEARLNP